MKTLSLRKTRKEEGLPRKIRLGRTVISVHHRKTAIGGFSFMATILSDFFTMALDWNISEYPAIGASSAMKRVDEASPP